MVTSKLDLTCCSLVMNLRSCRAELAASLQTCIERLLQVCCKLKLLYGTERKGPKEEKKEHYEVFFQSGIQTPKRRAWYGGTSIVAVAMIGKEKRFQGFLPGGSKYDDKKRGV
ncbi:hypothetical protein AVEN_184967-1 [Araneus ventricosus]|uniref:Uncharacterized protein n=1 Tax=Araneus ventricosus TaxID=182803 RepID=A0A4Y2RLV0_ARAVE|nr:hypothetical protein AVEN_184967-1 [Araneus ventricosus]